MMELFPGDIFAYYSKYEPRKLISLVMVLNGGKIEPSTNGRLCVNLYLNVSKSDNSLVYPAHQKYIRERLLGSIQMHRQKKQYEFVTPIFIFTSRIDGKYLDMSTDSCTLYPPESVAFEHLNYRRVNTPEEFMDILIRLRADLKISNRHYRNLQEVIPFIRPSFTPLCSIPTSL